MKSIIILRDKWQLKDFLNPPYPGVAVFQKILAEEAGPESGWLETQMPNVAQEVLWEHGLLDKSVLETGVGDKCIWAAERDWAYRTVFSRPENPGRTYLEFLGLDTVADILFNGEIIARHESQFLSRRIEITGLLLEQNELLIYFHSPKKIIDEIAQSLPERYKGKISPAALLRKAHGDFSPHGGAIPYFTPIGVFDDVRLIVMDECEIRYADVDVRFNRDFSNAYLRVRLECPFVQGVVPRLVLNDDTGAPVLDTSGVQHVWTRSGEEQMECILQGTVANPKLWWPKNYGGQPLYTLDILIEKDGRILDLVSKTLGLRWIELVGDMKFRINGRIVKLWGSCITPMWGASHRWIRDRALTILDYADKGNMNVLRLWGPSQPYNEEFYEATDRLGILLWQDFYTSGTYMPDSDTHVKTLLAEAVCAIRRLKHHASILLWCGGNEQIYMADLFAKAEKDRIGHDILYYGFKNLCESLDPYRYYHVSSPSGGEYANQATFSDTHGSRASRSFLPGENYASYFSENIRTFTPELKSLKRFIPAEGLWPDDYKDQTPYGVTKPMPPAWMARTINHMEEKTGPYELFFDAIDPESLVYKINAAAAYDIKRIICFSRRGKPFYDSEGERKTNGHMIWKLNTAWPQIYCAYIDYYLEPGQPYYTLKRAYSPIHISFEVQDHVYLWGVNDTCGHVNGEITLEIYDLESETYTVRTVFPASILSGESSILKNLDDLGQYPLTCVLHAVLRDMQGNELVSDFQYLKPEKRLTFPDANLTLALDGNGALMVTADRFARCVEISGDDNGDAFGWHFEDNYFDMMPGETRHIRILGKHRQGMVTAKAHYARQSASCMVIDAGLQANRQI